MKFSVHLITILFLSLLVISACSPGPTEYGILEGHVNIGPLVPVMREGETPPTPSPEVYAARQIVVFKQPVNVEVVRIEIDDSGYYRAELPVGEYVIDINRAGIDSADGLPMTILIEADQTFQLDIDIDTGIR
ncbi:MAG: hypothetical protein P8Y68_18940 [Anaerolineales bacterium]